MDCEIEIKKEVEEDVVEDFHSEIMVKTDILEEEEDSSNNDEEGDDFGTVSVKQENPWALSFGNVEEYVTEFAASDVNVNQNDEENTSEEHSYNVLEHKDAIYQSMLKCFKCSGTYFLKLQNLRDHCENFHKVSFSCNETNIQPNHELYNCEESFKTLKYEPERSLIVYECTTCSDVRFLSGHALLNHVISVHEHKVCSHCDAVLSTNEHFSVHLRQHFNEVTKFKCPDCINTYFQNSSYLNDHMLTAHDYKTCDYPDCSRVFPMMSQLNKHKRKEHLPIKTENNEVFDENGRVTCILCLFSAPTLKSLEMHKSINHFRCRLCYSYFISQFYLDQHYNKDHPKCERNARKKIKIQYGSHFCYHCSTYCKTRANFLRHKNLHKNKISKCTECEFESKNKIKFTQHQIDAHPKFICTFCNKHFINKKRFQFHINNHIKNQCEKCSFAGISRGTLKSHIVKYHNQFNCERCPFTCLGLLNFESHIDEFNHKFYCSLCKYSTLKEKYFRNHIEHTHWKLKDKFLCDVCLFQCRSKFEMKQHIIQTHLY